MLRTIAASILVIVCAPALATSSSASDLILRARCADPADYTESGTWIDSDASAMISGGPGCTVGSRSTTQSGAYAEFSPHTNEPGEYMVYVCWGAFNKTAGTNKGPNADNVTFSITDENGSRSVVLNQRGEHGCSNHNEDQWIQLGIGTFKPDGSATVRMTNTATGQCHNGANKRYANMDAVELVFLTPLPTEPTSWSLLKQLYR